MVQMNRTGSDSVELWNDDSKYLVVSRRAVDGNWQVRQYIRDSILGGTTIHQCATADDAIEFAKGWLTEGQSELDQALKKL